MRRAIFFLFLILLPLAFASKTETTKVLNINGTATVYGKTLTVLGSDYSGKLKVNVDGVVGIVKPGVNRTSNVNGMYVEILNFTYVDEETIDTILKIIVNDECGDDACNITESMQICCTDCGCEGNLKCIDNICTKEECVINADCDDNNPCTVDACSDTPPRICSNTLITQCVNNDTCCPDFCDSKTDNDCEEVIEEEIVEEQVERPPVVEEPKVEEPKKVAEGVEEKKQKGIFIMVGVALLVVIIGFFIFVRK